MEGFSIEVTRREDLGKGASRRFRRQKLLPVIIYHKGTPSVPGYISYDDFVHLGERAKVSQIFLLKSDDKEINGRPALVRDIQKDYVKGKLLHVDFLALKEDEEISVQVALSFVGEAVGVKTEGGLMTASLHELEVSCLPKDIPTEIVVNVSGMRLNDSIHAGDIDLPKGVTLITGSDEPVVSISLPKAEVESTTESVEGTDDAASAEAAASAPAEKSKEKGEKAKK